MRMPAGTYTGLERMRLAAGELGCVMAGVQQGHGTRGPLWLIDVPDCQGTTISVPVGCEGEVYAIVAATRARYAECEAKA